MLITKEKLICATKTVFSGFIIGTAMLIPGLSGGTAAIIIGIYGRLTDAAGSIITRPASSMKLLLPVGAGAFLGIFALSKPMMLLFDSYYTAAIFFFIGCILGAVPMLIKFSGLSRDSLYNTAFALLGTAAAAGISFLPSAGGGDGFFASLIAGVIISIGMVLPGISTSHLLLALGMYDKVWGCIHNPDILFLFPLILGGAAGTILTAKFITFALKKFPCQTYMVITGFVISSVYDIFPGNLDRNYIPLYIFLTAAGFLLVWQTVTPPVAAQ